MSKILVVDDDSVMREMLKRYLSSKGYEVCLAEDAVSCIDEVDNFKPDMILLDIMMPGMGGIETLKEIKKIDPNIGVIMVTGLTDKELARRTFNLGAYDYIMKPFSLAHLDTVVMTTASHLMAC